MRSPVLPFPHMPSWCGYSALINLLIREITVEWQAFYNLTMIPLQNYTYNNCMKHGYLYTCFHTTVCHCKSEIYSWLGLPIRTTLTFPADFAYYTPLKPNTQHRTQTLYFAQQRHPYFPVIKDVYTPPVLSFTYSPCIPTTDQIPTLYVTMDRSTFQWLHGTHHLVLPRTAYPGITLVVDWDWRYIDNSGGLYRPIIFNDFVSRYH